MCASLAICVSGCFVCRGGGDDIEPTTNKAAESQVRSLVRELALIEFASARARARECTPKQISRMQLEYHRHARARVCACKVDERNSTKEPLSLCGWFVCVCARRRQVRLGHNSII